MSTVFPASHFGDLVSTTKELAIAANDRVKMAMNKDNMYHNESYLTDGIEQFGYLSTCKDLAYRTIKNTHKLCHYYWSLEHKAALVDCAEKVMPGWIPYNLSPVLSANVYNMCIKMLHKMNYFKCGQMVMTEAVLFSSPSPGEVFNFDDLKEYWLKHGNFSTGYSSEADISRCDDGSLVGRCLWCSPKIDYNYEFGGEILVIVGDRGFVEYVPNYGTIKRVAFGQYGASTETFDAASCKVGGYIYPCHGKTVDFPDFSQADVDLERNFELSYAIDGKGRRVVKYRDNFYIPVADVNACGYPPPDDFEWDQ